MKFLPLGDSHHPDLDYNTHITFPRNERGINLFVLQRSREIDLGNVGYETVVIVVRIRIIMAVRSILQLQRRLPHNDGQMSIQECVSSLWCLGFLPQDASTHPILDWNTHTTFPQRKRGICVFYFLWMHDVTHGNTEQEAMAIDFSFGIILVMRPVIHFQRMSTHNEGQMSVQENVGCLRSMKFLPQGDSPVPVLDYNIIIHT